MIIQCITCGMLLHFILKDTIIMKKQLFQHCQKNAKLKSKNLGTEWLCSSIRRDSLKFIYPCIKVDWMEMLLEKSTSNGTKKYMSYICVTKWVYIWDNQLFISNHKSTTKWYWYTQRQFQISCYLFETHNINKCFEWVCKKIFVKV